VEYLTNFVGFIEKNKRATSSKSGKEKMNELKHDDCKKFWSLICDGMVPREESPPVGGRDPLSAGGGGGPVSTAGAVAGNPRGVGIVDFFVYVTCVVQIQGGGFTGAKVGVGRC